MEVPISRRKLCFKLRASVNDVHALLPTSLHLLLLRHNPVFRKERVYPGRYSDILIDVMINVAHDERAMKDVMMHGISIGVITKYINPIFTL